MATPVDVLLVRIEADLGDLKKDLKRVEKQNSSVGESFSKLGRLIGTIFAGAALAKVTGTIRTFEDLQATLKAVTGSAELAADSFNLIRKFTATTTFQLEEVSGAFITLVNAGIAPTSDALRDIGNIAAARGKDIRDVAQALFNATTGEMEMLKQLGIVARLDGEKINVTYKEVTETIDRSGASIVEYIRNLSQAEFPNAIAERSATLSGAISNLGDNISEFFMAIGDSGFTKSMTDLTKFLIDQVNNARPLAVIIGKALSGAFNTLRISLEFVTDNFRALSAAVLTFIAIQASLRIAAAVAGMIAFAKALRTAATAQAIFNKNFKKSAFTLIAAAIVGVAVSTGVLDEALEKVADKMGLSAKETAETEKSMEALDDAMAALGGNSSQNLTAFEKALTKVEEKIAATKMEATGLSDDLAKAFADLGIKVVEGGLVFPEGSAEVVDRLKKAYGELAKAQKKVSQIDLAKSFVDQKTKGEELQTLLEALRSVTGMAGVDQERLAQAIKNVEAEMVVNSNTVGTLIGIYENAGSRIADSLAEGFMKGRLSLESFRDIAEDITQQVIAAFIRMAIVNRIINSIFGLSGTSSALPTIGGSASGGTVQARTPIMVGERGPEIFVPNSAGSVLNNMNSKNAVGGGAPVTVNQNLNLSTGVAETVRAEVLNLMPIIRSQAVAAVMESKQRGGAVSRSFV